MHTFLYIYRRVQLFWNRLYRWGYAPFSKGIIVLPIVLGVRGKYKLLEDCQMNSDQMEHSQLIVSEETLNKYVNTYEHYVLEDQIRQR